MSFLDELAFGFGRDWRAWARWLLTLIALVALAAGAIYYIVDSDYSYVKASLYTGAATGEYHAVGERLAARAKKKRGRLTVVETPGSVENVRRLVGENGRCQPAFAFVQDGVPVPDNAGVQTLGRLPHPESLLLFARRGRSFGSFQDLKGASIGIGPAGSGTAYLMQLLLENSDLKDLDLRPSNHSTDDQAALVRSGALDLAAYVINENAPVVRNAIKKYDLEVVSPADEEGLLTRDKWLRLGRIPAGFFDLGLPSPSTDKVVAQVDTLVMTNSCVGRAERIALLSMLSDEFPSFVRSNPPPSPFAQDAAPLADESREFLANGQPALPDRYFPRLVNLMSPAYWIYLAMAVTVLFNGMEIYSRFRLWRLDANREQLEARLRALTDPPLSRDQVQTLPASAALRTPEAQTAATDLLKDLETLRARCRAQLETSWVTPMGREMYYRYQEQMAQGAITALTTLMSRSKIPAA
jgi:TRAP-type uncharacterized transport system substrate-binding protein